MRPKTDCERIIDQIEAIQRNGSSVLLTAVGGESRFAEMCSIYVEPRAMALPRANTVGMLFLRGSTIPPVDILTQEVTTFLASARSSIGEFGIVRIETSVQPRSNMVKRDEDGELRGHEVDSDFLHKKCLKEPYVQDKLPTGATLYIFKDGEVLEMHKPNGSMFYWFTPEP